MRQQQNFCCKIKTAESEFGLMNIITWIHLTKGFGMLVVKLSGRYFVKFS